VKKKNSPSVSVLIPTYNCAQYIREAINSILAQDYDNLEIIVADDGSTDDTREIVETLHKTVKYFYKPHSGISASRNLCLEKAQGEYIAWCDADDYWAEGKLKAQMQYMEEHPDCQIVFTKFQNFVDNEELKKSIKAKREIYVSEYYRIYFPSALIKKELFTRYGIFLNELMFFEDTELIYRFAIQGVNISHYIDNVFYFRRLHGKNITLTHDESLERKMNETMNANLSKYIENDELLYEFLKKMHYKGLLEIVRRNVRRR
jgi:glycosyltransferase involved in cell wall biosynthesis